MDHKLKRKNFTDWTPLVLLAIMIVQIMIANSTGWDSISTFCVWFSIAVVAGSLLTEIFHHRFILGMLIDLLELLDKTYEEAKEAKRKEDSGESP